MISLYRRGHWVNITLDDPTVAGLLRATEADLIDPASGQEILDDCLAQSVDLWVWPLEIDESKDWTVTIKVFLSREEAEAAIYRVESSPETWSGDSDGSESSDGAAGGNS